jgi:hypothetical protein
MVLVNCTDRGRRPQVDQRPGSAVSDRSWSIGRLSIVPRDGGADRIGGRGHRFDARPAGAEDELKFVDQVEVVERLADPGEEIGASSRDLCGARIAQRAKCGAIAIRERKRKLARGQE